MSSYARVPLDEGGSIERNPRRPWLPWLAFAVGMLATIGYYERNALSQTPVSETSEEPLSQPTSWSFSHLFQGVLQPLSQKSAGDASLASSTLGGGEGAEGCEATRFSLHAELESTRTSLFTAQRVADERGTEIQELRSELDSLRATASTAEGSLSQCTRESSASSLKAASAADELSKALLVAQQEAEAKSSSATTAGSTLSGGGGEFDIDSYREARLAATQPNIIECAEASEGASQEACHLPPSERFPAIGQKGATVWMTGLSGSGKSTVARALERKLVVEMGLSVQNLDGDNVRTGLNRDLGFSPGDRAESVRRVGEMACLFSGGGVITLVTLVSPYKGDRDAARKRHQDQGIPFLEVLLDVPLSVVQDRDPKGLYAKAASGALKGMTGMSADAPYEPPTAPEVVLPTHELPIDESVALLLQALKRAGALSGGPTHPLGLPLPYGTTEHGKFLEDELTLTNSAEISLAREEAKALPQVLVSDIEVNWLQVIGEGWAAPLRGFLREGPLMQVLHFNSLVTDPFNRTGAEALSEQATDWNDYKTRGVERVGLSVPIVLPVTEYTKNAIEAHWASSAANGETKEVSKVALVDKDGRVLALLTNPEVYPFRKEEVVTRCFGAVDRGHPYISHLYGSGDWLVGGEVQLLGKVRYHDGLDKWRLTPKELYSEFETRKADVVYAFQTRNPTHAGHAYLMKTGLEKLKQEHGFKRPLLWLSPLGGWTKDDDVPLDVRVKQHQAIIDAGMLDKATTVMAIWPAPMIYGGPTEVQFHASSRRNGGAAFFVVGRDAAGMKGSPEAEAHPDEDLYKGEHARYVLQMSPVLEDGEMGLISFDKFFYDTTDHEMKAMDPTRPDDFISISGSKMRALARQGATPCPDPIPSDLLAANCVPKGFMVQSGWDIVCDYYQRSSSGDDAGFLPWSKAVVVPDLTSFGSGTARQGQFGAKDFKLFLTDDSAASASSSSAKKTVSAWHDVPLLADREAAATAGTVLLNLVVEIPMHTTAKLEVSKGLESNPLTQDLNKDGSPRYYQYGSPFFNYGMLPRTWEDPSECEEVLAVDLAGGDLAAGDVVKVCGDDDPLDVMEVGAGPLPMGAVVPVKVLGSLELIDEGEVDYKIVALRVDDADAWRIHDMATLEVAKPGTASRLADWLTKYKTAEGKGLNALAEGGVPQGPEGAMAVVAACHARWFALAVERTAPNPKKHFLGFAQGTAAQTIPASPIPLSTFLPLSSSASSSASSLVSSSPFADGGAGGAAAVSSSAPLNPGGFSACMALCRSLVGDDSMRQECVTSCIGKYGRRRLLRQGDASKEPQGL